MAKFSEQMQKIFEDFEKQFGAEPVSLDVVADWAIQQGRFYPSPRSVLKLCREALADSLREEKRMDPNGRVYRAKHSIRESVGGVQLTLWADIDTAPKSFMEKSFAQRRKGIVSDCFQIKQDVDHFNETRGGERPIQMIINFTEDVAEMEAFRDQKPGESKAV